MKTIFGWVIGYSMGAGFFTSNPWIELVSGASGLLCLWLWHKVDRAEVRAQAGAAKRGNTSEAAPSAAPQAAPKDGDA